MKVYSAAFFDCQHFLWDLFLDCVSVALLQNPWRMPATYRISGYIHWYGLAARERANLPTRLWKDLCYVCLSTDTFNSVCVTSGQDLCHKTFQYDLSARLVLRGLLCDRRGSFNTNLCTQEPQKLSSASFFAWQAQGFSAALAMGTLRALEHFPRFWSRNLRHLLQKTQRRLCESSAATKASCPGTVREPALSQWTCACARAALQQRQVAQALCASLRCPNGRGQVASNFVSASPWETHEATERPPPTTPVFFLTFLAPSCFSFLSILNTMYYFCFCWSLFVFFDPVILFFWSLFVFLIR